MLTQGATTSLEESVRVFFEGVEPNTNEYAVLPYIRGLTEPLQRPLKRYGIKVISKPLYSNISLSVTNIAKAYIYGYTCEYKNTTSVNIFLVYSHYDDGEPFLMGGGLFFCSPPVTKIRTFRRKTDSYLEKYLFVRRFEGLRLN